MKMIEFADSKVSSVCLGTMMMGTRINREVSFNVLDDFMARGGNFLDTSNNYSWWWGKGNSAGDESENLLGEWMETRKNRSNVFLATKFGARLVHPDKIRDENGAIRWEEAGRDYEGTGRNTVKKAVEESLRRLKTDYIDLYYIHVDDRSVPLEETLEALADIVKEGKVRYIGCSNMRSWRLAEAGEICRRNNYPFFSAVEQEYSYIRPGIEADRGVTLHADDELFDYIKSHPGVKLVAYSPLLKGVFSGREQRENYYDWKNFNNGESLERIHVIENMSKDMGITGNQLVMAWMIQKSPLVIPIIGFSRMEQYNENIAALDITLSREQLEILHAGRI